MTFYVKSYLEEEEEELEEVLTADEEEALVGLCSTLFGTLLLSLSFLTESVAIVCGIAV